MHRNAAITFALLAITGCIFAKSLGHDFVIWDDDKNIYKNELIQVDSLDGIAEFWKRPFVGLYVPLTYSAWSLLALASDTVVLPSIRAEPVIDPTFFHAANLLLHLGSTALVLFLTHELLGRRNFLAAALGTAFFAFHPLQVEPVAWATGMKDLLGSFLALLCVVLYLRHSVSLESKASRLAPALYAGAFLFFILALLAKPSLVVVPLILALLDFLIVKSPWKRGLTGPGNLTMSVFAISALMTAGWFLVVREQWAPESKELTETRIAWILTGTALGFLALAALAHSLSPRFLSPPSRRKGKVTSTSKALPVLAPAGLGLLTALFWILAVGARFHPVTAMIVVTLAFLALLAWQWPRLSDSPVVRLIPFFAAAAAFAGFTVTSQPEPDTIFHRTPTEPWERPIVALDALAFYISKTVYPLKLAIEYGRRPQVAFDLARGFPVWIVPLLAAFLVLRIKNHRAHYFAAFGIALAVLLPVLGLIPFGFQGQSTVADRYVYLSMFGVSLAVASWITFSENSRARFIIIAIIPFLAILSFLQVSHWRSSEILLRRALAVNPLSVSATYNLGLVYGDTGRVDKALRCYEKTIELKPDFSRPYNNMGFALNENGRPREAIPYLEKTIELAPESGSGYSNLGISYNALGDYERAIKLFKKALELNPEAPDYMINIAVAFTESGDFESAIDYFSKASKIKPAWFQPYRGKGDIYMKLRNYGAATASFEELLRVQPGDPLNYKSLANACALAGKLDDAIAALERGLLLARQKQSYPLDEIRNLENMLHSYKQGIVPGPG